ncbi:hypothetical protein [Burkholderia sp. BCC0405]|uniref:hypothetical protein n=1 Tax=Burkholderia sp. BCC0405 TaxID=2676298 RepID=UPI00158A3D61|nr:hypothetical protein [Burkholderia sp. BCC0405]
MTTGRRPGFDAARRSSLAIALDRGCTGLPDASDVDAFPKPLVTEMQRTLRLPIRISHVENGGRTIDANVRVLPEGAARRHAESMALHVVTLAGEHTVQAVRPPQICVIDRDTLPRHTRNPAALLVNIPPICRIDHIPACSNDNRPFPHRFRAVDTTNQSPSVRLTILDSPLATLRELARAESQRADRSAGRADAPRDRQSPTVHRAGGWRSASR